MKMAIRFYCPFCDQLLGIAQRRVGAVVECPRCHGKVGVPPPDVPNLPAAPADPAPSGSIVVSRSQLTALLLALALLLLVAFTAGLLVGSL